MTILRVSTKSGSPCGKVALEALVGGIDLEDGKYALSYHDTLIFSMLPGNLSCMLTLGSARATVEHTGHVAAGGNRQYTVAIESPNVADFIAMRREVARRLGWVVEDIDYPFETRLPREQSFIHGLGNDLRRLHGFMSSRFAGFRRSVGLRLFAH